MGASMISRTRMLAVRRVWLFIAQQQVLKQRSGSTKQVLNQRSGSTEQAHKAPAKLRPLL
jgi:hypothetical protein